MKIVKRFTSSLSEDSKSCVNRFSGVSPLQTSQACLQNRFAFHVPFWLATNYHLFVFLMLRSPPRSLPHLLLIGSNSKSYQCGKDAFRLHSHYPHVVAPSYGACTNCYHSPLYTHLCIAVVEILEMAYYYSLWIVSYLRTTQKNATQHNSLSFLPFHPPLDRLEAPLHLHG